MNLTGGNLIAGTFQLGKGKVFSALNPRTGETLPTSFHEASFEQVGAAAGAAQSAFQTYRRLSGAQRAEFLETIAARLEAAAEPLIVRCTQETGLPEARLKGELAPLYEYNDFTDGKTAAGVFVYRPRIAEPKGRAACASVFSEAVHHVVMTLSCHKIRKGRCAYLAYFAYLRVKSLQRK